jgi:hypothetical protein
MGLPREAFFGNFKLFTATINFLRLLQNKALAVKNKIEQFAKNQLIT